MSVMLFPSVGVEYTWTFAGNLENYSAETGNGKRDHETWILCKTRV